MGVFEAYSKADKCKIALPFALAANDIERLVIGTHNWMFGDVDMMCLTWIAFGFELIGHPHKWMSLKVYTIHINVPGLEFDVFVHITSC